MTTTDLPTPEVEKPEACLGQATFDVGAASSGLWLRQSEVAQVHVRVTGCVTEKVRGGLGTRPVTPQDTKARSSPIYGDRPGASTASQICRLSEPERVTHSCPIQN